MVLSTMDKVALESSGSLALKTGFDLGWAPGTATYLTGKGVEGWVGSSPIRRAKSEILGGHGTHAERGYKDERLITVTGHHVAADRAAAARFADDLAAFLGDGEEGIFRVDDAATGTRWAEVYLAAGGVDVTWTGGRDVGFQIFMVANDPRKYGPLVTSSPGGVPVAGNGLVFPLFSAGIVSSTVNRTNHAPNPALGVNDAGWASYGGGSGAATGARLTSGSLFVYRVAWTASQTGADQAGGFYITIPVPASKVWSARISARPSRARNLRMGFEWLDASQAWAGAIVGPALAVGANAWGELTLQNQAAPGNAAYVRITVYPAPGESAWMAGDTLDGTRLILQEGSTVGTYFDGSTDPVQVDADTYRSYSWTGAAGVSTSQEATVETYGQSGALDIGRGGYLGRVSAINTGTADAGVVFTVWGDYVPGFTLLELASGRRLVYTETLTAGQTLVLNSNDGSVTLDGTAPRDNKLVVSDWTRLGRGESGTWQFESPGSVNAKFTVGVSPAWW